MKKTLIFLLILLLLWSSASAQSPEEFIHQRLSQEHFDHDYFMEYVLFGKKWTPAKDPTYFNQDTPLSNLAMVEFATTLCIDQFNNNQDSSIEQQQSMLNRLRKKVGGLPGSVDELNPDKTNPVQLSGRNHRTYTHRGWKFNYDGPGKPGNIAHSEKRETILRRTVSSVFGFKMKEDSIIAPLWYSITGVSTDEARCECYCRLFYYIHLLGDCYEDQNYMQANGSNNGQKIPLGRANPSKAYVDDVENSDIITELIWACEELFASSTTNTMNYPQLKKELKRVEQDIRSLYRLPGGVNSPERYEEYHRCTCELMQVLIINMPNLLKNEDDFQRAFKQFLN